MIVVLIAYILGRASKRCPPEYRPVEERGTEGALTDFFDVLFSLPGPIAVVVGVLFGIAYLRWSG